jgi:hypothetical protein
MGKDGCNSAPFSRFRLGGLARQARIEVLEEKLVHSVIGSVRFQQNLANVQN